VAQEPQGNVILTSQPHISGEDINRNEILKFMADHWFKPLHGLNLGKPGSLAFYRDLDEVAAFDAHPGNFVKDANGFVLPIDLILLRADGALQRAFDDYLT
jgi:hypothetical protein